MFMRNAFLTFSLVLDPELWLWGEQHHSLDPGAQSSERQHPTMKVLSPSWHCN